MTTSSSRESTNAESRANRPAFQTRSRAKPDRDGRAQAKSQRSHQPHGGEEAEGRESEVAEVEEGGMHVLGSGA